MSDVKGISRRVRLGVWGSFAGAVTAEAVVGLVGNFEWFALALIVGAQVAITTGFVIWGDIAFRRVRP